MLYCVAPLLLLQHGAEGKCAHGQRQQHQAMVDPTPLLVDFHVLSVPDHPYR